MDYHIQEDKAEKLKSSDRTCSDNETSNKSNEGQTTSDSLKTPMLGSAGGAEATDGDSTKKPLTSLPALLSSRKNRTAVAIAAILTFVVIVLVATSPRLRRRFDQYSTNHGVNGKFKSNLYCNRNDAFYNTTSDDGLSGCSGTCYAQYRNSLVPSEGYSNGCSTCYCDPSTYGFRCTMNQNCTRSTCQYNGWYYQPGEVVPYASGDSCNTCTCNKYYNEDSAAAMNEGENGTYYDESDAYDYEIVCTENECNTCIYEGASYEIGQSFVGNGCPYTVCTCGYGGNVTCADNDNGGDGEEEEHGGGSHDARCEGYCTWEGYVYETYSCFQSIDGWNMCSCMDDGSVICTDCANLRYD